MTPPALLGEGRAQAFYVLVTCALLKAAALAAAAFATRAIFASLNAQKPLEATLLIWLGLAGLLAASSQFMMTFFGERMAQSFAASIRNRLFDHASRSSQSDLEKRRLGYHLLRFSGDLNALTSWPSQGLPRLIEAGSLLPAAIAVLWILHPPFAWVASAAALMTILTVSVSYPKLKDVYIRLRFDRARLVADMAERVPVAPQLAAMGRQQKEHARLQNRTASVIISALKARRFAAGLEFVPEAVLALVACAILWIGARDGLPPAYLAGALAALALTLRPLRNGTRALQQLALFGAAYDKLHAALARQIMQGPTSTIRLPDGPLSLSITNQAGHQHSFDAGTCTRVSAIDLERLAPILSGTHPADRQIAKINGIDLQRLNSASLGQRVGVLSDAPLILKGSLRRNLTLGQNKRPKDDDIIRQIEAAGHSETLARLGPLSRRLPENGGNLTRMDRMNLCLLRLILQSPGLLLALTPGHDALQCLSGKSTILYR